MKKTSEIAVLCGARACVVVYDADAGAGAAAPPEVWPSAAEAARLFRRYRGVPEGSSLKKATGQLQHLAARFARVRGQGKPLLQIWPFVPVPNWLLSRFWNRDKASGTKASRGFCPGWKNRDKRCLTLKNFLLTTGFDPKISCSTHGFLANSPK